MKSMEAVLGKRDMKYFIGIDLGTSSVKAMIIDEYGTACGTYKEDYQFDTPRTGYAEQNPEVWWEATASVLSRMTSECAIDKKTIYGMGLSGQMHGTVMVDRVGHPVENAIIWCDQRSGEEVREIEETIGRNRLGQITLNSIANGFQLSILLWLKKNKADAYDRCYKVLLPKDYIRLKLTGEIGTDMTDASGTLAFDAVNLKWSEPIIGELGLDINKYPRINSSCKIAGYILNSVAEKTGLRAGIPVVYGGGDQSMQAIGNSIIAPGNVSCTIGTGGQVLSLVNTPIYDTKFRVHTFCSAVPGRWNVIGANMCAGLALKWYCNNILDNVSFEALDREISSIAPGSEGLIFLPYLLGNRTPHMNSKAKGIFFGLTVTHDRWSLARAVMEGVVFNIRESLDIIESLEIPVDKIIASGGGASSIEWMKILADITGREIYRTNNIEHACLGAAITAAVGIGTFPSVMDACKQMVMKPTKIVDPNPNNTLLYNEFFHTYKLLYGKVSSLYL